MIIIAYIEKQLSRHESGKAQDALYRMASHVMHQFPVVDQRRLVRFDQGEEFTKEESDKILTLCTELVSVFS